MGFKSVKKLVERDDDAYKSTVDSMPRRFIEQIVMQGMKIEHIERDCYPSPSETHCTAEPWQS